MPTHHLEFAAHHDGATNSTWIVWQVRETGLAAGAFYELVRDQGRVECLWEDMHDVSVRCAAQKALGHFQQWAGLVEPF